MSHSMVISMFVLSSPFDEGLILVSEQVFKKVWSKIRDLRRAD
jgi:hypothetical protein